ncbi:MAG: NAD-dependent deacylase [Halanaerobiales bacterium]|nr:NAD-dependent deacylase [Halanaerobiales bacterium]
MYVGKNYIIIIFEGDFYVSFLSYYVNFLLFIEVVSLKKLNQAVKSIKRAAHITVFTGAGISVESGIPPFRGENGLWQKYDPYFLNIEYFINNPKKSWRLNKKIFYDLLENRKPNNAHKVIAGMEKQGLIKAVITQNIDNLHQKAGSKNVYEFHGTYKELKCMKCGKIIEYKKELLKSLPPICNQCGDLLKPNYIFFGEGIPQKAYSSSVKETEKSDLFIVIGTTGEVQPASLIPFMAHKKGATIIEINIKSSNFTSQITDIFLNGKASKVLKQIYEKLNS